MIMINAAREITDDLEKSKTKGCNQAAIIADDVRKYTDSTEEYLSYVRECAPSPFLPLLWAHRFFREDSEYDRQHPLRHQEIWNREEK
jgi:hypothetical protein